MNYAEDSINLHKKLRGKIKLASKIELNTKDDLATAYTPGVAAVSSAFAQNPELAKTMSIKGNSVAIVTDGSAVLGLGNLGPIGALPVMEGKALLFKEFADIDAFPICLDTQDPEEIIKTVKYIAPVFGGINLEDIAAPLCFEIERRLKTELNIPVMHDDQQGTAVVVLAGLINSLKVKTELTKSNAKIVINGAGAAGTAITKLLMLYGFENIVVCDSKGILNSNRTDLNSEKQELVTMTNKNNISGNLSNAVQNSDIFIGVSKGKVLTTDMVKSMNTNPIIFALANPEPEIMPDLAKEAGALIVATGRSDFPNQINNVLAFPGIFRGALDNNIVQITPQMLLQAAQNLADHVSDVSADKILPDALDKTVVKTVASAIKN